MEKKIKVLITQEANATYLGVKVGDVVELEMERYISGVVGAEIGNAHLESCRSQAIAARSHIWNDYVSKDKPVQDSVTQAFQAYRADSKNYKNAQQGASDTKGMLLYYEGRPVKKAKYSNCNGGRTKAYTGLPYMPEQIDEWDYAVTKGVVADTSHRQGMSQSGCKYAASIGVTYDKILAFYYPGTEIVKNYGEKEVNEPVPEEDVKVTQYFQTENPTYTDPHLFTPTKILLHEIGCNAPYLRRWCGPDDGFLGVNKFKNYWNSKKAKKSVHANIGRLKDDTIAIYQNLPYNYKCWGCGSGVNGSYNSYAVQFEMCRDGMKSESYYKEIIKKAEDYCVFLCKTLGIKVDGITSHDEAAKLGYASNHGDPSKWMKKFGDSMDKFRARVAERLKENGEVEKPSEPVHGALEGKFATIETKFDAGLNLWSDTNKTDSRKQVAKGETIFVLKDDNSGWVYAQYDGVEGYAATKYLLAVPEQRARVNTLFNAGLNLWKDILKSESVKKAAKGAILLIGKDFDNGWVLANFDGETGYVAKKYLVNI
jgi:N-acetylmuramoyl-L-alanine amidase